MMSYAVSKAALDQFSLILSGNYAPDGVRVNSIRPATVATDFVGTTGIPKETVEKMAKEKAAKQPLAGLLKTQEVAKAIWISCDPELPSLTGQNITIHGGRIEDTPWINPFG
jgi:NAD(P)-dependent dehydrogenase (short-subunit alcohol dehydrogenase family)